MTQLSLPPATPPGTSAGGGASLGSGGDPSPSLAQRIEEAKRGEGGTEEMPAPGTKPSEFLHRPETRPKVEARALEALGLEKAPCHVGFQDHLGNEGRVLVILATGDDVAYTRAFLEAMVEVFQEFWEAEQRPAGIGTPEELGAELGTVEEQLQKDEADLATLEGAFPPATNGPKLEALRISLRSFDVQRSAILALDEENQRKAREVLAEKEQEVERQIAEIESSFAEQAVLKAAILKKREKLSELDSKEVTSTAGDHHANAFVVMQEVTRTDSGAE